VNWLDSTAAGAGLLAVGLATALVVLAFAALPRGERYLARGPAALLVLHLAVGRLEGSIDANSLGARLLSFVGAFAIFASLARSAFLLGVMSSVARRFTRPWPRILRDLLQAFLYFGVGLLALRAAGVEPTSLLATSALLTAVIGLSLQETLGNLFAGLSLQAQPPFSVGDWLQYADGADAIGRVIEINWRATHLVTLSEIEVIVPNGVIAKAPLKNFSRPTPLIRHTTSLVLPDSVSPQRIVQLVVRLLADLPGVLPTPAPSVLVGPFVERGASYSIRYFVDDFSRIELSDGELRKRLWYALRRANLELPVTRSRVEAVAVGALPTSLFEAPAPHAEEPLAQRLSKVDFLAGVAQDVLDRLLPGTSLAVYAPGEVIIHAGEEGSELFVIERGSVDVLARRGDGIDTRIASLGPGQFFGEAALLAEELRAATVLATSESQLIVISRAALRAAVEQDRSIAERLTSRLASRLSELEQALSSEHGDDLDEERRSLQLIDRVRRFFA
jgi:small-conductance mechanosensitive channel/CRP-like cAMP-binding protein